MQIILFIYALISICIWIFATNPYEFTAIIGELIPKLWEQMYNLWYWYENTSQGFIITQLIALLMVFSWLTIAYITGYNHKNMDQTNKQ